MVHKVTPESLIGTLESPIVLIGNWQLTYTEYCIAVYTLYVRRFRVVNLLLPGSIFITVSCLVFMLPPAGTSCSVFNVRRCALLVPIQIDPFTFSIFYEDFEWHFFRRTCLCFRKAVHMWCSLGVTYFVWYVGGIKGYIPHIMNGFIFFTYHPPKQFFGLKLEFTKAIA